MSEATFAISGSMDPSAAGPFEVGTEQTPVPMVVVGHADETVHILEGRVRIEPEVGQTVELTPGSVASFNRGTSVTWTVLEPTIQFFVYS